MPRACVSVHTLDMVPVMGGVPPQKGSPPPLSTHRTKMANWYPSWGGTLIWYPTGAFFMGYPTHERYRQSRGDVSKTSSQHGGMCRPPRASNPHQFLGPPKKVFFLMIRRPPRSTHCISSAASDVYKRQLLKSKMYFASNSTPSPSQKLSRPPFESY